MQSSPGPARYTDTLADLFASRRAIPIALLAAALCVGQLWFTPDVGAFAVAALLVAVFLALAPHAWRRLFGVGRVQAPLGVRVALFVGLGVVAVAVFAWALPHALGYDGTFLSAPGSLFVEPALFCVGGWGLGRDIEMERRNEALALAAEQAQILALRAHLDPHFFFNTLNALAEWCRIDGAIAERGILGLAVLIRAILEAVRVTHWTLSRELELVRQLFELHRLRDPSAFDIALTIDAALDELTLPSLVLLPIAENAMTHGPARGARTGHAGRAPGRLRHRHHDREPRRVRGLERHERARARHDAHAPSPSVRRGRRARRRRGTRQRRANSGRRPLRAGRMKVVIGDDELLTRLRLERLLAAVDGVEVVAVATGGTEALRAVREHGPDVLLLDIHIAAKRLWTSSASRSSSQPRAAATSPE